MEINEIFPPNVHFEVLFNPNHFWQEDHFFGCSLRAAFDFLKDNDYVLMTVEFNNAFFVDRSRLKTESSGKEISKAYAEGYLERDNRWMLFPWNRGMEFLESWTFEQVREHFDEIMNREPGSYILKMVGTQSMENQEKETSSESKSRERIGEN
jgi:formate-dependent nitrite reductase cytochrome c552 subunit